MSPVQISKITCHHPLKSAREWTYSHRKHLASPFAVHRDEARFVVRSFIDSILKVCSNQLAVPLMRNRQSPRASITFLECLGSGNVSRTGRRLIKRKSTQKRNVPSGAHLTSQVIQPVPISILNNNSYKIAFICLIFFTFVI